MIHVVCSSLVQDAGEGGGDWQLRLRGKKGSRGGTRHLSTQGRDQHRKPGSWERAVAGERQDAWALRQPGWEAAAVTRSHPMPPATEMAVWGQSCGTLGNLQKSLVWRFSTALRSGFTEELLKMPVHLGTLFCYSSQVLGSLEGWESPYLDLLLHWTNHKGFQEAAVTVTGTESWLTLCNSTSLCFSFLTKKKKKWANASSCYHED